MTSRGSIPRAPLFLLGVAVAVVLTACGGGGSSGEVAVDTAQSAATEESGGADAADGTESGGLPSVELLSVPGGETVNLASLAPSQNPLVLWFWAPH